MDLKRFTRKPFPIHAVQVTNENFDEVAEWCGGTVVISEPDSKGNRGRYVQIVNEQIKVVRQTRAFRGDWVLSNGDSFKVFNHRAFLNDFNEVVEDPCGMTQHTVDNKPCILGKGHFNPSSFVGCRSFQDYKIIQNNIGGEKK